MPKKINSEVMTDLYAADNFIKVFRGFFFDTANNNILIKSSSQAEQKFKKV